MPGVKKSYPLAPQGEWKLCNSRNKSKELDSGVRRNDEQ